MDYKTGSPVVATLSFKDSTGKFLTAKSDYKGAYIIMLNQGEYFVQVGADGYYPKSLIIHPMAGAPLPRQNFFLVKIGDKFVFTDVNFTVGNAELGPNAPQLLESIAKVLRENPEVRIEIGGHTSSPGSSAYNQKLSEARANVVRNALIDKYGIKADRLTHKGYGEDFPVATNNTKEGRALNRRMEVTIIK
jgi:outer membrane protein OmpA-like peptidoglycan-associated protein